MLVSDTSFLKRIPLFYQPFPFYGKIQNPGTFLENLENSTPLSLERGRFPTMTSITNLFRKDFSAINFLLQGKGVDCMISPLAISIVRPVPRCSSLSVIWLPQGQLWTIDKKAVQLS